MERNGIITVRGRDVTLIGNELKVGDEAPDFVVIDKDQKDRGLGDFNREAAKLSDNLAVLNISVDLPFAIA